jgi:hypothetical protein
MNAKVGNDWALHLVRRGRLALADDLCEFCDDRATTVVLKERFPGIQLRRLEDCRAACDTCARAYRRGQIRF